MGADRYSVCPRCQSRRDRQVTANSDVVADAYGKLPLPEFDKLRAEAVAFVVEDVPKTLREDYEFVSPVDDGELRIVYKAMCSDCGLKTVIDETRALWTSEEIES
jgi:hypothetical protein